MKISACVTSWLLIGPLYVAAKDPWPQANEIMLKLVKRPDPIRDQPPEIVNTKDISFYTPIDYYEDQAERNYKLFWDEKADPLQKKLYQLLTESSNEYNNINATYTLSQMHLYRNYGIPDNKTLAFHYLDKYNNLTEHTVSETLFQQAVAYSTGLFGAIPVDSAKGVLFYQRAARLGDLHAKQVLANKYYNGINVPRDFNRALILYREIADQLKARYTDDQWSFQLPYEESFNVRLSDFEEGLLGPGLNSVPLSTSRKKSARPDITSSVLTNINGGHVVLRFRSMDRANAFSVDEGGESDDQLVDIFYTALDEYRGTYTKDRDVQKARLILEATFKEYDADVGYLDNLQRFFYGKCLDLLGHIYFTGESLEKPDILLAEKYLRRSILVVETTSTVKSSANIDLGLIYQYYYYNDKKAIEFYRRGRKNDINNGIVEYQLSHLTEQYPDLITSDSFMLMKDANSRGYLPAKYEFSKMAELGVKEKFNCEETAYSYKSFVEENESIMAPQLRVAFNELLLGNTEVALWAYAQAAEQGYEMAQISAAYLLYQIPYKLDNPPNTTNARKLAAITYYARAFKQDNIDAGVVAGDVYYDMGKYEKAFSIYHSAAKRYSSQAIWNLGYMYEYGLGVPVDYHLAKRYYDLVLEYNSKSYLAVKLNVAKLKIKTFLIWLIGEDRFPHAKFDQIRMKAFNLLKTGKYLLNSCYNWTIYKDQSDAGFRIPHKTVVESGFDTMRGFDHDDNDNKSFLENLGFYSEDIFSLVFVVIFFFGSFFLRHLAARRGWNMQVNGIQVGQGNQNRDEGNNNANDGEIQPQIFGNFNVQIFAI